MGFEHRFYFLRHGETEWNQIGRTQGQLDAQLNKTGRRQAEKAAGILAREPIERIIASPLSRARHTAEAVAARHGIEISFDEELMECHLGDLQGQPHGSWLAEYWTGLFAPPNGETFEEFCQRTWKAMGRAVSKGPNTLIVAHGGLWRAAQTFVTVEPELNIMPNALPIQVSPEGNLWHLEIL